MSFKFNPEVIGQEARMSEHGERYVVVSGEDNCRLGAGARCTTRKECTFFVEVSLHLCQQGLDFDIQALKRMAVVLQSLKSMGYEITCEMGLVTCEKAMPGEMISEELETVQAMICL